MIREHHRREILQRLRTMRRYRTIYDSAREHLREKLREAYLEGATPLELKNLTGYSYKNIQSILKEEMKQQIHRKRKEKPND